MARAIGAEKSMANTRLRRCKDSFSCGWQNLVKFRNELDKWLENRILNDSGFLAI